MKSCEWSVVGDPRTDRRPTAPVPFGDVIGRDVARRRESAIKSEKCIIVIYSSSDSAVVTKLQDFGKKSNEALAEIDKKKESAAAKK
jgi:hypothetical protein